MNEDIIYRLYWSDDSQMVVVLWLFSKVTIVWPFFCTKSRDDSVVILLQSSPQCNGHGDFRVQSVNEGHLRATWWLFVNVTWWLFTKKWPLWLPISHWRSITNKLRSNEVHKIDYIFGSVMIVTLLIYFWSHTEWLCY